MVRHLTPAWIEALDEAARGSESLRTATADAVLTVQQVVTTPDEDIEWHLAIDHGAVSVTGGRAEAPDLTFVQDLATARDIARGELSAQVAFMVGRLRVGGDLRVLLDQQVAFGALEEAFAGVRAVTEVDDGA